MGHAAIERRLPIGAETQRGGGVHFRVWAPGRRVEVVVDGVPTFLVHEEGGYHGGFVAQARSGSRYGYRVDGRGPFPDPASRAQPDGVHALSEVVDPAAYVWRAPPWRGAAPRGQVIYELHVGTLTRAGTFAAAIEELPRLRDLGITMLEVMPIAAFDGKFGWGYDGVDLFAPYHGYGTPDDVRAFVDAAHMAGLSVILDVVYNHFGPSGCYLRELSPAYFHEGRHTEWGQSICFDGPSSAAVRELFVVNARYWIDEFRFDGLRLDATHAIHDPSARHIVADIATAARAAAGDRPIFLIGENDLQEARFARPIERGGCGLDALWNDDYHHAALAAATGRGDAYYSDTHGTPQELLAAIKWGYLFQGQRSAWQKKPRGAPALDLPAHAFVVCLENHDQVAHSARGARLSQLAASGVHRALVALTLLAPQTPMLFQGEELGARVPFLYFADHEPELAALVCKGRAEFLRQFPALGDAEVQAALDDPASPTTFERCKLSTCDRRASGLYLALYGDLLRLRREDAAFSQQRGDLVHGTVLGERAFALRYLCSRGDRLVVVNLGATIHLSSIADPLVAPPNGDGWRTLWSSEALRYGGEGVGPVEGPDGWRIGGQQTTVLAPAADAPT